jgi:DeoR family transcriptional regulator, glycerol-3-phosphate regulon repressor
MINTWVCIVLLLASGSHAKDDYAMIFGSFWFSLEKQICKCYGSFGAGNQSINTFWAKISILCSICHQKTFVFEILKQKIFTNENPSPENGVPMNQPPDKAAAADSPRSIDDPSAYAPSDGKIMHLRARHAKIQDLVQAKGFVTIDFLAREFGVTPQTIRRDINTLSRHGIIHRYHGGAGIGSSTENVAYNQRKMLCFKEKQKIARMVASQIPDHASLFINIGTTTEAIAQALFDHKRLRIITNNLNVASILSANENFEVIVAGGLVRQRDGGIIGEATIDFIHQFKVDYGIIGISGIDSDGTLLDFDYREVRAARAIIDNSRKVFLAADHTKFGRNAMVRLGSIVEIDAVFTDQQPPAALKEIMAHADVQLFAD